MKQKTDFITNSSSSSFVAWGIVTTMETLKSQCGPRIFALMKKKESEAKDASARKNGAFMVIATKPDEALLKAEFKTFMESPTDYYEISELLDGIDISQMPYDDEIMIGRSPFSQKDDQTLLQFKQEICDKINALSLNIKPEDLRQIEEAWMDN